jgi:hypothetical protein
MNRHSFTIIALSVMILGCSKEGDAFSHQSDDPCSKFIDQRTCELMSMHDSVKRICNWTRVEYLESLSKRYMVREICVSVP